MSDQNFQGWTITCGDMLVKVAVAA